jgi:hypothetical protein
MIGMVRIDPKIIKWQLTLIAIALLLGGVLSNFTADFLAQPAANLMKLATGGGSVSSKKSSDEIPMTFYPRLGKAVYNPLYIASRALSDLKSTEAKDRAKGLDLFLKRANWLKENLRISEHDGLRYGIWEENFPFHYYGLRSPWRCGMAQGYGIAALAKANEVTGDASYLEYAKYALNAFFIEVKDGGVTYKDSDDAWWFEEYAGGNTQIRVLNGAIYAVLDIYDFWKATGDRNAEILYEKGLNAIKNSLDIYDTGSWTYYDAIGTIATKHYHNDHIKLARQLHEISNDRIFLDYSNKWANYNIPYFILEFCMQKPDYHDIAILALNVGGILLIEYVLLGTFLWARRSWNR